MFQLQEIVQLHFTATTVGGTAPYIYTLVNNDDGSDDGGSAATNALTKAYTGKTIGATYVVKVTDINGCVALVLFILSF